MRDTHKVGETGHSTWLGFVSEQDRWVTDQPTRPTGWAELSCMSFWQAPRLRDSTFFINVHLPTRAFKRESSLVVMQQIWLLNDLTKSWAELRWWSVEFTLVTRTFFYDFFIFVRFEMKMLGRTGLDWTEVGLDRKYKICVLFFFIYLFVWRCYELLHNSGW